MKKRRTKTYTAGATLIEALIAMAALGVGAAGVFTLLAHVSQTNRRAAFQTRSLDIASEFATQVRDAACDVPQGAIAVSPASTDPGLNQQNWYPGTGVTIDQPAAPIGSFNLVGFLPGIPPVHVSYRATAEAGTVAIDGPPAFDVEVRIREVTGDPDKDDPNVVTGFWMRTFPIKKVCNIRLELNGRGEYY